MDNDFTLYSDLLVVDDSLFVLKAIHAILRDKYNVQLAQSADIAYYCLEKNIPDLILLDLEMPNVNGYEFLAELKKNPLWHDIPVIFLTGSNDRKNEEKALCMGAVDYILKPISEGVLKKRIQMHLELKAYQKKLESLVDKKTVQLIKTQDLILDILANVTTFRDNDTGAHIIRTTNYVKLIVEKLLEIQLDGYDMSVVYADNIIKSAKLHDIGKIAVPDDILLKDGTLTPSEFEIIKLHTVFGAKMIENSISQLGDDYNILITAREIILYHHEWWNGRGYPENLTGDQIPVSARIMAIADVYDALISRRSYKKAFSHDDAVSILKRENGTHFDDVLMGIAEGLFPEFKEISHAFQD